MNNPTPTKCAHCGHTAPCAAPTCWHPSLKQALESAGVAKGVTRAEILDTAKEYVTVDRAATHGNAENNFALIAGHWTWWLGDKLSAPITAYDVAQMMVGFKQARAHGNPANPENAIDAVGYAALAGEIATSTTPEAGVDLWRDAATQTPNMYKPLLIYHPSYGQQVGMFDENGDWYAGWYEDRLLDVAPTHWAYLLGYSVGPGGGE